ncbi:hypothetical protein GCM10011376_35620 [Nocardioides flavus (ex Wang et al. 2016)]|uniref:DUF3179 domain-containing protein n=1 Tax=Nocardioides flavus (ex Wang et al. 2016) TaxID=2058780 RepID=A0ABQ3HQN5_9ACTN|nr:DUF3179 domain-containing protein [Nocardioides flavus (ex Wang et al. 2016)]GHE18952.1 hypothetical protein GCM10011376_35620 [Nocardioides flavus (ex Wang et al. 2016)]
MNATARLAAAGALSFVLGACATTPGEPADRDEDRTSKAEVDDAGTATGGEKPPSALDDPTNPDFPEPLIDLDDLLSGGPPPDGIPSIDYPLFQPVSEVNWLEDDEPVLSLTINGKTKAYPIRIMTWHEIVNDRLAGVPVAVTYCPLCNSGVAFERTIAGETTTFKVSGKLYADNLVMYDRLTESLWPQLTGRASVGALTGTQLESIPVGAVGWRQFREEHPDARVLSRSTGHDREYVTNPYVGYDDPDSEPLFALPTGRDARLPLKARVVGVGEGKNAVAVSRDLLADRGVQHVALGQERVVLWHAPGQVSALDTQQIPDGAEIGSVAAFLADTPGRALNFERADDGTFRDAQTGSVWNLFGRATSGPLAGERLTAVEHLDTFWFAWAAFQPETRLVANP